MSTRKKWTKEEDKILVQAIKANPHNRALAFRKASKKINRSEASCSFRWYSVLSNPEHKLYVGCMFTLIGNRSRSTNRSIISSNSIIPATLVKETLWVKIKKLLNL